MLPIGGIARSRAVIRDWWRVVKSKHVDGLSVLDADWLQAIFTIMTSAGSIVFCQPVGTL